MKRLGKLFPQLISFKNLWLAFQKAQKGSRVNGETQRFFFHLEEELLALQGQLQDGSYEPSPYRYFKIYDPKERTIAVAPFRDRVVHHALVNILEPIYDPAFIYHSYATRKGKGTHRAIWEAQAMLRKHAWFFKADIQKFFETVDQKILLDLIRRKIKDRGVLALCDKIVDNGGEEGQGLPIGNLTSQFFANVYLNPLDHFVKHSLGAKGYIRYMDDFVLFHSRQEALKAWHKEIKQYLGEHLHLILNDKACVMNHYEHGLGFLGRRIYRSYIRIKPENLRRLTRRLRNRWRAWQAGECGEEAWMATLNSYWAYLAYFPSYRLRQRLLQDLAFLD